MTKPVPIEAAKAVRVAILDDDELNSAKVGELVDFALQFETRALPGMSQEVVAGELREIRLIDDSLEAQSFDLIRLNGRTFAPETVNVVETLHVAGNGNELTTETVDFVIAGLESDPECAAEDAVRLIKFLVEVVLEELREDEAQAAEIADLKTSVIAFAGPFADAYGRERGWPKGHLAPHHFDILAKAGARMVDFVRHEEPEA